MIQLPPYATDAKDQQSVYDYTIPLGDDTFRVVLTHRERQDRWYIDIYTVAGAALVTGYMLAVDGPCFEDLQIAGLPAGTLALYDTSGSGEECGFADLGSRCWLVYLSPDELPEPEDPYAGVTVS
jgi:hypothetical protein